MALTLIVVKDVYNLQKKYTTKYSSIQQNDCLPVGQICVVDLSSIYISCFHFRGWGKRATGGED